MIVRYALMVTLTAVALYGLITMSATTGQVMLVDAGAGLGMTDNVGVWVLGAIAGLTTVSLCRFVAFGLPAIVGNWYESKKNWLTMLIVGGLAGGVFYLM